MTTWMNEHDISEARRLFAEAEVANLHQGADVLNRLVDWTNSNSDGWPYWDKPSKASQRLQAMLEAGRRQAFSGTVEDISEADLKKALTPIKAFLTKHGADAEEVLFPKPRYVPTLHEQHAPATAYALDLLAQVPNRDAALILLTLAAAADRDLYSGDGYNGHSPEQVHSLLGLHGQDMDNLKGNLDLLLRLGLLVWGLHGRYRIPQVAYDRSNGVA